MEELDQNTYCISDAHGRCLTCSDEALPAKVLEIDFFTAIAEIDGRPTEIDISLMDDVSIGDTLLVHGGVALGTLSPQPEHLAQSSKEQYS